MGSNFYTRAIRGCPPLGPNRKHPCPLTGWLALILGQGTIIPASLFGVYTERGYQLTKPHPGNETCGSTERGKNGNVAPTTLTSEKVGWRKAGMLQQYHLAALHVTTWLGHLSSEIIATLEHAGSCLTSNEVFIDTHMPRTNFQANMQNTYHIKCSNMLAWFREVGA